MQEPVTQVLSKPQALEHRVRADLGVTGSSETQLLLQGLSVFVHNPRTISVYFSLP